MDNKHNKKGLSPKSKRQQHQAELEQIQEKLLRAERLAAVGELASGVGHELRNPLNVIRNCAYLLKIAISEKNDKDIADALLVLDKQIDIANKIVTDLLDFTRIMPPMQTRADLKKIIEESLSWVSIPEQVKVNVNLNGQAQPIRTDPEQMGRVFSNLIANAVQAMNGKAGEVDISSDTNDGYISVIFRDTGCGIPEENMPKIFEPLFTTRPKGIGLGLAIAKRLVEQNGGKIEVSSQVSKGTTFTVKIPVGQRS